MKSVNAVPVVHEESCLQLTLTSADAGQVEGRNTPGNRRESGGEHQVP